MLSATLSRSWFKKAGKSLESPLPVEDEFPSRVEAKETVLEVDVLGGHLQHLLIQTLNLRANLFDIPQRSLCWNHYQYNYKRAYKKKD